MSSWQMNKEKADRSAKTPTNDESKAGDLFTAQSLEEHVECSRKDEDEYSGEDVLKVVG